MVNGGACPATPPQTIILEPVQIVEKLTRAVGAPMLLVESQESPTGSYRPPVSISKPLKPPQTTIVVPVQTAPAPMRALGAPAVEVAVQIFPTGSYCPPLFK